MITARFPVGVEVERRAVDGEPVWTVAGLRPGVRHVPDWTVLAEAEGVTRYYAGTARLALRADEARLSAACLQVPEPCLTVSLGRSESGTGWTLRSVSLRPEADQAPDEMRAALPIPPALRAWIVEFVARYAPDAVPPPPVEPVPHRGFLDRWSRRKTQDRAGPPDAGQPAPGPAPATLPPAASEAGAAPELPPLDSLRSRADYAAYLRAGAPRALRLAALRQAWVSDPAITGHKPLVDYDWDFSAPGYGRLLPGDSTEKLVESLFGHLRRTVAGLEEKPPPAAGPAPTSEDAAAEPDPAASSPSSDGTGAIAAAPAAASPPAAAGDRSPRPEDPPAGPDRPGDPPARPRRHGGATPA